MDTQPVALSSHPTLPIHSPGWIVRYGLANAVIGFGTIAYYTVVLPPLLARLAPGEQAPLIIGVTAIGALLSTLTVVLTGLLSDRWGARRRPWMLGGALLSGVFLLLPPFLHTATALVLISLLLQVAMNMTLLGLTSLLPDQVSEQQRGQVAAAAGLAPVLGAAVAQQIVSHLPSLTLSCTVLALGVPLLVGIFLLGYREQHGREIARPRVGSTSVLVGHPAFVRVWVARALMFLGYTSAVNYLALLLAQRVPLGDVGRVVPLFFGVSTLALILSAVGCGWLSDRLGQRKPFVLLASLVMAAAFGCFLFVPAWWLSALLLGLGMGGYVSVEFALATQVLPGGGFGRAMGIVTAAIYVPQLLEPLLALASLRFTQGYTLLLVVLLLASVLSAGLIATLKPGQQEPAVS